jgi:hypothetical protein
MNFFFARTIRVDNQQTCEIDLETAGKNLVEELVFLGWTVKFVDYQQGLFWQRRNS